MVVEAAVFHDIDHFVVGLRQLFCGKLEAVIYKVSVKAHACQFTEQFHEMTFREAALFRGFFDGDITVIKFLHIVERVFQSAVGELQMAVVAGGSSAVQAHVVKEEEETGFDHQLMGGITLFPVL